MRRLWLATGTVVMALSVLAGGPRAMATVEMQNEAKALGYSVKNCLYCHASPHAVEKMRQQARSLGMGNGNCLLCHGKSIPAALNHRGEWLVEEQARRQADEMDMAWLSDYEEAAEDEEPDSPEREE